MGNGTDSQGQIKFFLSSGGTGGHIFPAECLAEELKKRGYGSGLITDDRYKNFLDNEKPYTVFKISSATLKGNAVKRLLSLTKIFTGIWQSIKILSPHKSAVMIGFGGYPSFPAIVAARFLGMKIVIHEQNSVLGQANRALVPFADIIATSFPRVAKINDERKIRFTGNPVRKEIAAVREKTYPAASGDIRIMVLGGSLGATVFASVVPDAILNLPTEMRNRIRLVQQCREENITEVAKKYHTANIKAELASFIKDVPAKLADTHLVISRSGASTIAELAAAGRPAILVPYPNSKDDHQMLNAESLAATGGAWVIPQEKFTADFLKTNIELLLSNPEQLTAAANKVKSAGRPDAAQKLADLVEKIFNTDKNSLGTV